MSPAATHARAVDKAHSTRRRPEPVQGGLEAGDAMLALQAGAGNQAVQALLGDGRPLDAALRAQMEVHFGDLGQVRIHTGPAAATSADALGATAYTVGRHIVFGHGEYAPGDIAGRALLAHELAHVVQQQRGGAAPASSPGAEHAATASATNVIAGGPPGTVGVGAATGIARQPKEAKEDRYVVALRANKEIAQGRAGPAPEGWPVDKGLRALWSEVETGSTDERSAAHRPAAVEFIDTVARYQAEVMGRSPSAADGVVDAATAASLRRKPVGRARAPVSATRTPATGAASVGGGAAAAEPGTSLGVIGNAVIKGIIRQATGGGIQHRMLAAAIGGFIAEMGRQLTGKEQLVRFKSALAELLVPRNLLQFHGGYLGGLVAGFISPATDLLGLGALAEQLPWIAVRLGKTMWEKAGELAKEALALGKAFAELPGLAWKALSGASKSPKSLIEFLDAAGEQAVKAAGGAGQSAAQAVVGYFTGKEEEQEEPAESIGQVFTSWTAEERRGIFSAITSKAGRLRKAIFTTPWSKIGYNVGYAIGAVVSNVLLLIFTAGIGNVIAKVGAWLGKLAPLFARVGELIVTIGKVITAVEGAIGVVMGKLLKPLESVLKPLGGLLERLSGFMKRLLGVAERQGGRAAARGGARAATRKVSPKAPELPEPSLRPQPTPSTTPPPAGEIPTSTPKVTPAGPVQVPPPAARVGEPPSAIPEVPTGAPPSPVRPVVPRRLKTGPLHRGATAQGTAAEFHFQFHDPIPPPPVAKARLPVKPRLPEPRPKAAPSEAAPAVVEPPAVAPKAAGPQEAPKVSAAQQRRLRNLAVLHEPRVTPLVRGRYDVPGEFDTTLTQMARELRASQAGISPEDFSRTNIAVAKVRINGKTSYMDAANVPASTLGASRGFDSEQLIGQQLLDLEKAGAKVELLQLYSERIPCYECSQLLKNKYPNASVFYTVPERRTLGEISNMTRGEALMRAYGLDPDLLL